MKLQEKEWFAAKRPDIASALNAAARRKMIDGLAYQDPTLHAGWLDASRQAEGESHLVRSSGRYPLCGRGDINTYSIFAETNRLILNATGRVGCIVPTGIVTDDTTKFFFSELVDSRSLVSVIGFENEEFIFQAVHHATKFCLLTISGSARRQQAADFVFFARQTGDVQDQHRHFVLSRDDIALLNPNTHTCPIFRSKRDAELTKAIYRRTPVLIKEGPPEHNPWLLRFITMFHMANDSGLFRTHQHLERNGWHLEGNVLRRGDESYVPLYEAKMIHQFDHRFGTYEGQTQAQANQGKLPEVAEREHSDANYVVRPEYWVPTAKVQERLAGRWDRAWLLGWRDICRATDQRTVIASVIPRIAVANTTPLMFPSGDGLALPDCLLANLTAFVLDYCARQKVGGTHLTYNYLEQLPILAPGIYHAATPWMPGSALGWWLRPRVLELTYTAWDLAAFARDCGCDGPPYRWNSERRFLLRAELDAAFFHVYGIDRDDTDYIMDTFPIVRRDDEAHHAEYRTKRIILEIYDAMAKAMASGEAYQTVLDPPPTDPSTAHPGPVPTRS